MIAPHISRPAFSPFSLISPRTHLTQFSKTMSAFQKIAVIGATGLIGKPVVKQLANAGFDLTLISRDASKVKAAFPSLSNAKAVQADPSDPSALKKAFTGIDAVVSLVGAPALTEQKAYIDAAIEAGVKRFIPSEFGCDTQAPYLAGELIFQAKRDTASYLKELAAAGKITYTLVATGLFFDNDLPYPVAGIKFKEHRAQIPGNGKELISVTDREDIGRYVAAILKHPDVTKNTIIRVAGDTVTPDDLVKKYEKQLGKKFEVTYQAADEIDRIAQEGLKSGNLGAYFGNRIPLFTATGRVQIDRPTEGYSNKLDNDKFPEVKPLSAEQVIAKL